MTWVYISFYQEKKRINLTKLILKKAISLQVIDFIAQVEDKGYC